MLPKTNKCVLFFFLTTLLIWSLKITSSPSLSLSKSRSFYYLFSFFWWLRYNQEINECWDKFIPTHVYGVYSTTALPDSVFYKHMPWSRTIPKDRIDWQLCPDLWGKGMVRQLVFWQPGAYCRQKIKNMTKLAGMWVIWKSTQHQILLSPPLEPGRSP